MALTTVVTGRMVIIGRYNAEWDMVNLSDPNSIKGLLKFRYRFDLLLEDGSSRYGLDSNCDLADLSDDIICLYADLDNLISKANFNEYQTKILNMYIYGNTEDDIAEMLGVGKQSINSVIDRMCEVLCELNYQDWKLNYVFWNKARVRSNFKKCSKCGGFLPVTEEYFYREKSTKDGFRLECTKCFNKNR